jgi:hypothetical protein
MKQITELLELGGEHNILYDCKDPGYKEIMDFYSIWGKDQANQQKVLVHISFICKSNV